MGESPISETVRKVRRLPRRETVLLGLDRLRLHPRPSACGAVGQIRVRDFQVRQNDSEISRRQAVIRGNRIVMRGGVAVAELKLPSKNVPAPAELDEVEM